MADNHLMYSVSSDWGAQQNCHVFEKTHFSKPTFCKVCNKFIWGLSKQGLSCRTCRMPIHPRCQALIKDQACGNTGSTVESLQSKQAILMLASSHFSSCVFSKKKNSSFSFLFFLFSYFFFFLNY